MSDSPENTRIKEQTGLTEEIEEPEDIIEEPEEFIEEPEDVVDEPEEVVEEPEEVVEEPEEIMTAAPVIDEEEEEAIEEPEDVVEEPEEVVEEPEELSADDAVEEPEEDIIEELDDGMIEVLDEPEEELVDEPEEELIDEPEDDAGDPEKPVRVDHEQAVNEEMEHDEEIFQKIDLLKQRLEDKKVPSEEEMDVDGEEKIPASGEPSDDPDVKDAEEVGLMEGMEGGEELPLQVAPVPAQPAAAEEGASGSSIPEGLKAAIDSISEFRIKLEEKEARLLHEEKDESNWWANWEKEANDLLTVKP